MDGTALAGDALLSPQPVLSPGARRTLPLAVVAAALAHAAVFILLLTAPGRSLPELERVTYDLVFVEPAAPPAQAVMAESAPPPEPLPEPPPARAAEPPPLELPAPLPPKPRPRPVAKVQSNEPTTDDQSARAGEPTASVAALPSVAVTSPPVAPAQVRAAADPAYAATLLSWLNRYKDYPWQARRRGVEGRVVLFLVVERDGKVSDLRVATSSGADILDEAALTMVRRANPMPPVPPGMAGDLVQFWIPVDYALSR